MNQWNTVTDPALWIAASKLCAMDVASWSDNDGLELCLNCNDVFVPASNAEVVPVENALEVLGIAQSEPDWRKQWRPLMKWVAKRRGYSDDMKWFCDRNRENI